MQCKSIICNRCGHRVKVFDILCGSTPAGYYYTPEGSEMAKIADCAPEEKVICYKCMVNSPGYMRRNLK